ncbi:MAG TPA: SURF1 family protein [Caulobacteraceae bacterium]|jgi:surfeit locus 1 family protein
MKTSDAALPAPPRRRPGLTIGFLVALVVLTGLGVWQLQRLQWKRALLQRIENAQVQPAVALEEALKAHRDGLDVEYARVVTDCPGIDQAAYLKLFAVRERVIGFRAVSACEVDDTSYGSILVDRGFVAEGDTGRMPAPGGSSPKHRPVVGVLRLPEPPTFVTPEDRPAENAWFRRDVAAMAKALNARAPAPLFLMLESPPPPGFGPTPAPLPAAVSNRHLGYALTWFGLAAALIAVYAAMLLKGRRP